MCRLSATNSTISGTIATVVAAITSVHCALYRDCRSAVATVSTRHLPPLVITSGHMKLFHCETTVISVSVTRIGLLDGHHHVHQHVQGVGAVEARRVDQVGRDARESTRAARRSRTASRT